jgi:hypothetical protein
MNADSSPAGPHGSDPRRQDTGVPPDGQEGAPAPSGRVEVTVTYDTSGVPHKAGSKKLYLMRDSGNPGGPVLAFTEAEWEAFVLGVKDGEFDIEP